MQQLLIWLKAIHLNLLLKRPRPHNNELQASSRIIFLVYISEVLMKLINSLKLQMQSPKRSLYKNRSR